MKIDIPDDKVRKLLIDQIVPDGPLGVFVDTSRRKLSRTIVDEIMTKYKDQIVWPKITKEEIKSRMLDILAERALEDNK